MLEYLFPVTNLHRFAKKNLSLTIVISLFYILFPTILGDLPIAPKSYFEPVEGRIWELYFLYLDLIYSRIGQSIFAFLAYMLILGTIFLFSGLRKNITFINFILPLISFSYIGAFLRVIDALPFVKIFHFPIGALVSLYIFLFSTFVLTKELGLKPIRSVAILLIAFLLLLFFGLALSVGIGMLLQELRI